MAFKAMGLNKLKAGAGSSRAVNSDILEILEVNKNDIVEAYKDGTSVTGIAKSLNDNYAIDLTERKVFSPRAKKDIMSKPKVNIGHIKKVLINAGVMTKEDAKPQKRS